MEIFQHKFCLNLIETDAMETDDSHTQKQGFLIFLLLTTAPGDIRTTRGCFLRGYSGCYSSLVQKRVQSDRPCCASERSCPGSESDSQSVSDPLSWNKRSKARVLDPHHFNTDPDPAFYFNADPAPAAHQALEFWLWYGSGSEHWAGQSSSVLHKY